MFLVVLKRGLWKYRTRETTEVDGRNPLKVTGSKFPVNIRLLSSYGQLGSVQGPRGVIPCIDECKSYIFSTYYILTITNESTEQRFTEGALYGFDTGTQGVGV